MGVKSSKTVVTRMAKNYNFEERAQKAIKDHMVNPKPAPYHPSESEKIERFIEDNPEIKEELDRKDTVTIDRMTQLQLDSSGTNPVLKAKELPQRRFLLDPFQLMENPETVPKGQVSLHNLAIILELYKTDPTKDTMKKVANVYNLDILTAGRILKYYKPVNIENQNLTERSRKKMKRNYKLLQKETKIDEKHQVSGSDVDSSADEKR